MPDDNEKILSAWDVIIELQRIMNEHVRLSWNQYKEIHELYGTPTKFWKDALQDFFPQNTSKFFELFNRWFDDQMLLFETNMENAVTESGKGIQYDETNYPGMTEYQKFVSEHVDLWMKNYKKLVSSREQYNDATLNFLKSIFPDTMHPLLDNAHKWRTEQAERLETEVLNKLENQKESNKTTTPVRPSKKKKSKK